jgi:2-hydroxy-6-oxonona-2,4-dienedioate hydrolase
MSGSGLCSTMSLPPALSGISETPVAGVAMRACSLGDDAGGEAPVFVLVHGLGMSGRYMMPTAERLAAHGRVYVPDLPGFGRSGKPRHALSIAELADSLAEWMAVNSIKGPVLVGNSLGGQVIVDFALRHPQRLVAAVLVGPTIDPEARNVSTQVFRLLVDILREPLGLYWMGLTDYLRAGIGRVLRTLRHALADPVLEKLPLIRVPVLIVRGGRDPIVPQRWVEQAAQLIPDARLVTLRDAAHAVNFNSPEALTREILSFLRDLRRGNF